MLRPDGIAALFWYTPALANHELVEAIDRIYSDLAHEIGGHMYQPSHFDNALEHLNHLK